MNVIEYKKEIMNKEISELKLEDIIEYSELFVNEFLMGKKDRQKPIKTHQIRRFYDVVKGIDESVKKNGFKLKDKAKLLMLIPQLANAMGKQKDLKELKDICTAIIPKINNESDFKQFMNFFQSLVAFHKAYAKE